MLDRHRGIGTKVAVRLEQRLKKVARGIWRYLVVFGFELVRGCSIADAES